MKETNLTPLQKKVIALVPEKPDLKSFYLTGGTALAGFYFHHRVSDDLDFFSVTKPDSIFLHVFAEEIKEKLGAKTARFEHVYDRNMFFFDTEEETLKIEFTHYPFQQFEPPIIQEGMRIDSMRDIAANKLAAMLDRFDPKDFVDLYFLLQDRKLEDIWRDAEKKFGMKIGPLFLGSELMKANRIAALPRMIKPLTVDQLKQFFTDRAAELKPKIFE